jgi:hypothetical protein
MTMPFRLSRSVPVHSSDDQHMSEKPAAQTQHANRFPSNSIFVGLKPVMSYVTAIIVTQSKEQDYIDRH